MKSVLLVEDCEDDIDLVRAAFERYSNAVRLETARSGEAALDLLRCRQVSDPPKLPVCILLDMCMTQGDGLWLLRGLEDTPGLRDIPVMVMSETGDMLGPARTFGNVVGASQKPARQHDFRKLVEDLARLAGAMPQLVG
ncbi:response regulator [uncultured Maricaulis sp.]|uniref:response regulator n=1 Tax=uncultured Maricaulis sp. TaxID=174710 RepID=UPI00262FEBFF|nr:response regulator [uncultured Maricaulis sp.]